MRSALLVLVVAGCALVGLHAAGDSEATLKRALQAAQGKSPAVAVPLLSELRTEMPELADYVGWYLASAQSELKNYAAVLLALDPVFAQTPKSPFRGRASLLAGDALVKLSRPEEAIRILKQYYAETTPPQSDMALADAYLAAADGLNAATYYQRVYFGYPQSPAAPRALAALQRLEVELGEKYPPITAYTKLTRALKLIDADQPIAGQKELEALLPQLTGADRDLARVRIGAAMYESERYVPAIEYLTNLETAAQEADAERLYHLTQSARKLDRFTAMDDFARRAGERHPKSQWSVDALTAAGNVHVMKNEVALYEPLFQACYEGASTDPDSEWCHWKVTWAHYLRRDRDAAQMLRDHVRSYPDSEHASTSLYFLSRIAEQAGDIPAARTYLAEIVREYPNLYYAMLARERSSKLGSGTSAPATAEFLRTIAFPQRSRKPDLNITTAAKSRIDRAAILARVGQRDLAEAELRFGADQGEQPIVLGMELARLLTPDDPAKAMRYMKRYARGYLLMPLTSAPTDFWKLAFPLPYRDSLEKHSQTNSIDPFLMAGLVRQESEFDPQARSSTGARGLSQIMPATGQDLARRMNLSYSVARLNQPDYNLQLGTYYVNWLLKQWNGNVEATLASYNAGMARVRPWIAWGNFREPAEFIETIPITQTREYVQAVQRNAATYREIYAAPPLRAAK